MYGNYPDLTGVKRVLVIKLRHHGDVLLASPVFTNLKKALPKAQIDALIYAETLPMLEGHPAIRTCHLYDRAIKKKSLFLRLLEEARLLARVRKERYDLVINLTEGDRGALIALASGAKLRVGIDPGKKGFLGKRKIYTHLAKMARTPRHVVEQGLDVVRRMGIFPQEDERSLTLHIPPFAKLRVHALLQAAEIHEKRFFLVHPVSRWRFKCPSTTFTAELLSRLDLPIVLTSGPDPEEKALIAEILKKTRHPQVLDLSGRISLKELGALIQAAHCLICVDSVPLHMASALQAPVVALFGPTSEISWGPWKNPHARIIAQNFPCRPCGLDGCGGSKRSECLTTLSVEKVIEEINMLSRSTYSKNVSIFSQKIDRLP